MFIFSSPVVFEFIHMISLFTTTAPARRVQYQLDNVSFALALDVMLSCCNNKVFTGRKI
jgi:hypothetical protein